MLSKKVSIWSCKYKNIFFTLGNHEFWSGHSIDEYKKLINECGMYLLCDNMFAINGSVVDEISCESIFSDDLPQIVNQYSFIFIPHNNLHNL